ncbi:hypothetical protein BGW36DRAFT_430016 [Talaromyces proteolyticus]|uniref:Uncharacterized protein n=1 Tax=Talaromyces proteolyticus TaxID=1131652 RepID=A0AAD4KLJ3_9EURO|nr:uncharacterized protein BGW36DRAFT_430016 [Talaromyces proteolyticus]KAH8693994.1 hypothetical protein BGW36DRAFT_430016 [Talaromyces proteolyticus]
MANIQDLDLNLTIPLKLDAFVLNEKLSERDQNNLNADPAKEAKIAPITQPNYTFLQLEHQLLQHDILDHVDLHNAFPASSNSRLYDLGKGKPRENRMGVYLHWVMPRFYRTGTAATHSAAPGHDQERKAKGFSSSTGETAKRDYSLPAFRPLPNRWLVIRKLDPKADTTEPNNTSIEAVESWVIESDRIQPIDKIGKDKDLQVDVSPYITSNNQSVKGIKLDRQAEIFIGYKESTKTWKEGKDEVERVDLTAVNSSNQLFLDYQSHCSNVFSTVDAFEYKEGETIKRLNKAKADYYVIGWHSNDTQGPFGDLDDTISREERLRALSMELKGDPKDWPKEVTVWLSKKEVACSVCHGAMYNVIWDRNKRPENIPANKASEHLLSSMPVTVGTTPIDSLLSYIDCHKHASDETPEQEKLENDLHLLEPLLRAQDEKVNVHRVAVDEVQNWNFARESGGSHWHIQSQEGEKTKIPSDDEIEGLEKLNNAQRVLDSTQRQIIQLRWDMFSHWWRYVSGDVDSPTTQTIIESLKARVNDLLGLVTQQSKFINNQLLGNQKAFPQKPQQGVLPEFSQPRDPTLLVSGIQAGWPDDYLDDLQVRLDNQLISSDLTDDEAAKYGIKQLPSELFQTAKGLVGEFNRLSDPGAVGGNGHYTPLYHDKGKHGAADLRDQWAKTQPWAPLFLEWQVEYFHIPWEDWSLSEALTPECKDKIDKRWRLAIDPKVNLLEPQIDDKRLLSGRILLLPQPNFSLHASIVQLLNSVSPEVKKKYDIEELAKKTWKLPFLSAPLDGFTDHLLTMVHGTHIKPNARYPAGYDLEGVHPIDDALISPFKKDHLGIVDIYSEQTPYGALLSNSLTVLNEISPTKTRPHPFKPVTHGQFRFSKLNIIDKFGQAINAIDARYGHEEDEAIYPYLSSYYEPQLYEGNPNLVRQNGESHQGHVEFAQVPPSINQPARLNSTFVIYDKRHKGPDSDYSYWRPVTEWENPIWGWIVLNYVDNGIQIFLQDGTFYREVRLASPNAPKDASLSAKWLPFPPPTDMKNTQQVDRLIDKLSKDQEYLHAFLKMANDSQEQSSSSVPSAYAGFLNSLVGRPLALVNAGWSLELSIDEKKNQALSASEEQPVHLLPENGKTYDFPIKLGDKDRSGDGLVGYFHLNETDPGTDLTPGNELDLRVIYTYYTGKDESGLLKDIADVDSNKPPKLSSFWLKPDDYTAQSDPALEKKARLFARNWNKKLHVFGTIVDPFLPITTFSSILPMNNLQLPPWTWQQAMQKMTAFFHLGPIVVTDDVEKYNTKENEPLPPNYKFDPANDPTIKNSAVGMPALQTGSWAWLQPFLKDRDTEQEYKALEPGKVDSGPSFERGPYTALEGYLQLKQPIVRPAVNDTEGLK